MKLRILSATALAVATLSACGGSDDGPLLPPSPAVASTCTNLAGKSLGSGTAAVTDAKVVAATGNQPEYCVVTAKFSDSALKFETRLPTSGWNNKLAFLGGGGFDGSFPVATAEQFSASVLSDRYATVGTNGGHDAPASLLDFFKAEFAYDPVQLADFTYQSEHRTLPLGKEVIQAFYGAAPARSYFEGCSMGGHDAMIQSQRYPQDFDGIVARAPAGNIMGLFMQFNRISKRVRTPANTLSPVKQALLANAVLAQCDGLDGLVDGIIGKPAACNFDATVLRCAGGSDAGDSCLSDAQVATVNTITTPIATSDGSFAHTGYFFGGENNAKGWAEYMWPSAALGGNSLQGLFSDGFVRSFIARSPGYDPLQWNPDEWLPELNLVGAMFSANNPDLSALKARGARMIMWNGTTDSSVSPKDNARYYESVVAKMGQANTDQVLELFQAPGVGHCYGGAGPDKVDLLKAMATWVEQGTAPSAQNLVHAKVDATSGATTMTRPVCKYPAYPRYKGSGDVNSASSFTCSTT
jgi:feruloyl esterase